MWLTIDELADYLKVSKETIYKMAKANKLPSSKLEINGGSIVKSLTNGW